MTMTTMIILIGIVLVINKGTFECHILEINPPNRFMFTLTLKGNREGSHLLGSQIFEASQTFKKWTILISEDRDALKHQEITQNFVLNKMDRLNHMIAL
ncbi:unnamed protein product [Cunninghamella echinulata]